MLALLLSAVVSYAGHVPSVQCRGSLSVNTSTTGRDAHAEQISSRAALLATVEGSNVLIAYEYQTYGGKELIQFLTAFPARGQVAAASSTGAILFPFHGSVYAALEHALAVTGSEKSALAFPASVFEKATPVVRTHCK